ncbi:MAG: hypothetical protein R6V44_16760 [Paracoccaceae bacterium]
MRIRIDKSYFTLPEVIERWAISMSDLAYLAENDRLRLSVRVFGLPVEFGEHDETAEGEPFRVPCERVRHCGLLDLRPHHVFRLFRCGKASLRDFRAPDGGYALLHGTEPLRVTVADLLLRRDERDRFEAETGFQDRGPEPGEERAFFASGDYHYVRCRGRGFRLGIIQAQVVRVLHEAARAGAPWQSGKAILAAAGSRSLKMADVFKSQPHWRHLIVSNGRGGYRLACD